MISEYLHKPLMQFNIIDALILYAVVIVLVFAISRFKK